MENRNEPAAVPAVGKGRRETYDWVQCVVAALLICILAFVFFIRLIGVDGISMMPTLQNGKRVFISNLMYEPKYGDIVVVQTDSFGEDPIIKRVIATGGQTVSIDFSAGVVSVDGVALDEPYTAEPTYNQLDFTGPVQVPEGYVFVMGDNRNHSNDSRDSRIGLISEQEILGRVLFRLFPLNEFGKVN